MKIQGSFETASAPSALRGMVDTPEVLRQVKAFRSVEPQDDGSVRVDFAPRTALGWIRLDTVLRPGEVGDERATLHAVGTRGSSAVTGDVVISYAPQGAGSTVTWEADLVVRGPAASTSQRVADSIARKAVGEAIAQAAEAAGRG